MHYYDLMSIVFFYNEFHKQEIMLEWTRSTYNGMDLLIFQGYTYNLYLFTIVFRCSLKIIILWIMTLKIFAVFIKFYNYSLRFCYSLRCIRFCVCLTIVYLLWSMSCYLIKWFQLFVKEFLGSCRWSILKYHLQWKRRRRCESYLDHLCTLKKLCS